MPLSKLALVFALGLSTPAIAADDATENASAAGAFVTALNASFGAWDRDHDGTLAELEIDTALADPKITGDGAAALAVVKRLARNKNWSAIPRTVEGLSRLATAGKEKAQPDLAGMFAHGQKHIASTRRELFVEGAPGLQSLRQGEMGNCFSLAPLGSCCSAMPRR